MQSIPRTLLSNDWILLMLLFALILLLILKVIDPQKLKGHVFAIFNKGFIEIGSEQKTAVFSLFYGILFLFSTIVFSLTLLLLLDEYLEVSIPRKLLFFAVFFLFLFKFFLEFLVSSVLLIKKDVYYFLFSKKSYLYTISFAFFVLLVLHVFSIKNSVFLAVTSLALFSIQFIAHLVNNKNLILSNLFYFILYLCAFEIAPLFILLKWIS